MPDALDHVEGVGPDGDCTWTFPDGRVLTGYEIEDYLMSICPHDETWICVLCGQVRHADAISRAEALNRECQALLEDVLPLLPPRPPFTTGVFVQDRIPMLLAKLKEDTDAR